MKHFFKNAAFYRLMGESARLTADQLAEALVECPHRLPDSREVSITGFIPPLGDEIVETPQANMMVFAMKESYRDLPSSVVSEEVQKKVTEINENEGRPVGRKERQTLKDETIFDLLPKCFIKHRVTHAMICGDLLIVDSSSANRAEEVLSMLRNALGSLKALPITTTYSPAQMMTHWVRDGLEDPLFSLGENCQLVGSKCSTRINVKNIDLQSAEVVSHIECGLYVEKLALEFNEEAGFTLDEGLHIKGIKFADVIDERIEDHGGDSESPRDYAVASLIITGSTVVMLIQKLIEVLGGEKEFELEQEVA